MQGVISIGVYDVTVHTAYPVYGSKELLVSTLHSAIGIEVTVCYSDVCELGACPQFKQQVFGSEVVACSVYPGLLSCHSQGFSPMSLERICHEVFAKDGGRFETGEMSIPEQTGKALPAGLNVRFVKD